MKKLCNFLFALFICALLLIIAPFHMIIAPIVTAYHWGGHYFSAIKFEFRCVRKAIKREFENGLAAGIYKLS